MIWKPTPQTVVAFDIISSGSLDDHLLIGARRDLRAIVAEVLAEQGIELSAISQTDLGDGLRLEVPGTVTPAALLHPFVTNLDNALRMHQRRASAAARLRLRMAIHHGLVHHDEGSAGNTLRIVARLLDARLVRRAAVLVPEANLVVAVSHQLYDDVIRHGYSIPPERFQRIALAEKEMTGHAWLYVPGHTPGLPLADEPPQAETTVDRVGAELPSAGPGGQPGTTQESQPAPPVRAPLVQARDIHQNATSIVTVVGDGSTINL